MAEEQPRSQAETADNATPAEQGQDSPATPQAERDQYKAMAQRTQADFINYKRRMEEERGVLVRNAANNVLVRLLPVLDDLQRAVDALPAGAPPSWGDGVRLVLQNLLGILQAEGVSPYEPAPGETFDPARHEALYYQQTVEQPAGTVLTPVRRGYRTQDRVLRPAQVVVAREPEEEAAERAKD